MGSAQSGGSVAPAVGVAVGTGVGEAPQPHATGGRPPRLSRSSPVLTALNAAPAVVARVVLVAYVAAPFEEQALFEFELLVAALIILAIAIRRRRQHIQLRNELAATVGVSRSALIGIPAEASAALLAAVGTLVDRSDEVAREALIDDLTGVYRRRAGMEALARDVARADRALVATMSVAMIDVDGLKAINDTRGHGAGDDVLRAIAAAVSGRLRGQDLVFRYGGDEFVCVFPNTDASKAWRLLDEIARGLGDAPGHRAFSFGVAEFRAGDSAEALVERADRRLYAARAASRPPVAR